VIQVDEFPAISSRDIEKAMLTLKDTPTTLMFHAEMIPPITDSVGDAVQQSRPPLAPHGQLSAYSTFLESRPPVFETCAIDEIVSLAPCAPDLHLHIVHLSATECIPILRAARRSGVNITAETCFHYLGLASDRIDDGDTRHKCCPPIRSQSNQDGLWAELLDGGVIRTVVSDHSPCTPELKLLPNHLQPVPTLPSSSSSSSDAGSDGGDMLAPPRPSVMHHSDSGIDMTLPPGENNKPQQQQQQQQQPQGDFFAAWGGISSVGLGLPILYTESQARGTALSITDIVRLTAQATARQVGLSHRKGGLRAGMDGDVCVFDDALPWTLQSADMRWRNRCSPWEGRRFAGRVVETWLRGQRVFALGGANGGFVGGEPVGEAITERRVI